MSTVRIAGYQCDGCDSFFETKNGDTPEGIHGVVTGVGVEGECTTKRPKTVAFYACSQSCIRKAVMNVLRGKS